MQYRTFSQTGEQISALGFGCMRIPGKQENGVWHFEEEAFRALLREAYDGGVNYFDTAYMYSDNQNERIVGEFLRGIDRKSVFLTTKLPGWCCEGPADFSKIFEEQLRRLGTDYLDFYLLHSLDLAAFEKLQDWGVLPFLEGLKQAGRIRHIGFSFHGAYSDFETILRAYPWEVCQIQYNYLDVDEQAGERGLTLAGQLGIPVIIMEGLRGGRLANVPADVRGLFDGYAPRRSPVEWAFRFLADRPEVLTVLSGMCDQTMLRDNLFIFTNAEIGCFTAADRKLMADARAKFRARIPVGCTGCRYCMPCPSGVDIPGIFSIWSNAVMFDKMEDGRASYRRKAESGKDASHCVGCGACEGLCPQSLSIRNLLEKAGGDLAGSR